MIPKIFPAINTPSNNKTSLCQEDPSIKKITEFMSSLTHEERYYVGLQSTTTLTGRDINFTSPLQDHLSESALHQWRIRLQLWNLKFLCMELENPSSKINDLLKISKTLRPLTQPEKEWIDSMIQNISFENACFVAKYDHFGHNGRKPLEHDVKASEYHVRDLLEQTSMKDLVEYAYFPFTSEDLNNLCYNKMLSEAFNKVYLPTVLKVCSQIRHLAKENAHVPVKGLTHGQPASPTTMGKRFGEYLSQFLDELKALQEIKLNGKCSGPVGNHNAMTHLLGPTTYRSHAKAFVESLGFEYLPMANQRNPHLRIVRLFHSIERINTILRSFAENIWFDISSELISQKKIEGHVGSSVMPQKVNPWRAEVAESLTEICNTLISGASNGLIVTRNERDLSDHHWERNYGELIGNSLSAFCYLSECLDTIGINSDRCKKSLEEHPEVLAELIQMYGRTIGKPDAYKSVAELVQGRKNLTIEDMDEIIKKVFPDPKEQTPLLHLSPTTYVGVAAELTLETIEMYDQFLESIKGKNFLTH